MVAEQRISALDAAQVFDYESRAADNIKAQKALKVGIVGFGTFGQFLAKRIVKHGHSVRCGIAAL
jgi:arogenate dehydrogenase (NADP+), plant